MSGCVKPQGGSGGGGGGDNDEVIALVTLSLAALYIATLRGCPDASASSTSFTTSLILPMAPKSLITLSLCGSNERQTSTLRHEREDETGVKGSVSCAPI